MKSIELIKQDLKYNMDIFKHCAADSPYYILNDKYNDIYDIALSILLTKTEPCITYEMIEDSIEDAIKQLK